MVKCMAPAVTPFIKQNKINCTRYTAGWQARPPQRDMLRYPNYDNEECSVPFTPSSAVSPGGVLRIACGGQSQRTDNWRYGFQTAVARSPALDFTAGLQANAAGTAGAVANRSRGYRPTAGLRIRFYQIFSRFAYSSINRLNRGSCLYRQRSPDEESHLA